jgi:hypothetical protein
MNARAALELSQGYGRQIQMLVKSFERDSIPEQLYDRLYAELLERGLFYQNYAQRMYNLECRIETEHNRQCSERLAAAGEYQYWLVTHKEQ